ncbi:MAG: hypothetical protein RIK87_16965 [Fuerstiella sp.]
MKFLPVLKWMIVMALVVAVVASGGAIYLLQHKDRLAKEQILQRFAEAAPELSLGIGSLTLNGTSGATLRDVLVRDRSTERALFQAKSLTVDIDSEQLLDHQRVVVQKLHVSSADILLTREADGRWNWQNYKFQMPRTGSGGLPVVVLDDLSIQLTLKHGGGIPAARLLLRNSGLQAVPKSSHGYDFDGAVTLPGAGQLKLTGAWDLESKQWRLGGRLRDVQADQQLMQLAKATAPELQGRLDQVDSVLERAIPKTAGVADTPAGAALLIGNNGQIAPQFLGVLDVDFDVAGSPEQSIPQFRLRVEVKDGRLASPAIPMALTNVRARFFRDNQHLIFRLDEARGDDASVTAGFEMRTGAHAEPGKGWFDVRRFPVTARLRPLLPEKTQRLFDAFQPEGTVSFRGDVLQRPDGRWRPENFTAEIHETTLLYHRFRYPVKGLTGTIVQRPYASRPGTATESASTIDDAMLDVRLNGKLGTHPFVSTGWWKNPGAATETRFELAITDFPLDSRYRSALGEKEQHVVESLDLSGTANAAFVFYRPPGPDQPTHTYMDAELSQAKIRFRRFPYAIDDLSGRITFNSQNNHWKFIELKGRHGDGQLVASGNFRGNPEPGVLDMTIKATGTALDADVYNALSPPQRSIWNMVNPEGTCDLTAQINWTAAPGQSAIISFPEHAPVRIYNTRIRPTPFPFDMHVKEAVLSFDPNDVRAAGAQHCEIHSFQAEHEGSPITASGWAEAKPDGEWQVHLNNVTATNLQPDDQLRAALPSTWRQTLGRVHHVGVVSVHDSEMDFRGDMSGQRNTTAGWDLNLQFRDCTLNAGLDVMHVYGAVTARGAWDGFHLMNVGEIDVETAEVLEMPFTNIRGPYALNDIELVLGSRRVFEPDRTLSQVDPSSRMKALAYGGELLFDAHVDLRVGGRYQFFTELADARLESYAALHIPENKNLKGVITAWLSLEGTAEEATDVSGKGQLLINPAALYEIPVIVKLLGSLSQLNLNVQDRTAFNYALLDFDVHDQAFWFDTIDLVGESISFRGRGSVGFGGAVELDFYSRPARSRATAIPIISGLFTNWAKIEVRGTTDRPQERVRSAARLDEGLRQFLQPFNPNPAAPIPGLNVPRVFQRTSPVLQRRRQQAAGPPNPVPG